MKITLTTPDGVKHVAFKAYEQASVVTVKAPCACGSSSIHGLGMSIESRDTYRARAVCAACKAPRGVLRVVLPTLFGLEEDEAVMGGPWRVY